MPVILEDATKCTQLLGWGVLKSLSVNRRTKYVVVGLRSLRRRSTQELVLKRTGEHVAAGFIRPYAICRTPSFVKK
jgi:hypothetical protein